MKILITGGAGYLGTELTYALAKNNRVEQVTVYDNLSRGNHNLFLGTNKLPVGKVKFVKGDLLDTRLLRKSIAEHDVVYHLAAKVTTPFADSHGHLYEQVNHWGTAEVVYAAEETQLEQLIFLSSVSVYGSGEAERSVGDILTPQSHYGISKMRGEEHALRYLQNHAGCIIRCGNVYGYSKSMRFDALINRFMFEANFHRRITINGNGDQSRAFVHIDKAITALSSTIEKPFSQKIYDLVEHNFSVNDLADEVKRIFPDLEMIFVNQHVQLRTVRVKANEEINSRFNSPKPISTELAEFKNRFSF